MIFRDDLEKVWNKLNEFLPMKLSSGEVKEQFFDYFLSNKLIKNAIETPDGTVLESHHRHDFKQHKDSVSGELYIIDGGTEYIRTSMNKIPAKDLSVRLNDSFKKIRKNFTWGTYGKNGDEPLKWVPICTMSNDHILNILKDGYGSKYVRKIFLRELEYRLDNDIYIKDKK